MLVNKPEYCVASVALGARVGINKAPRLGICSRHPQGVLAVYADGSVHFLNDKISQANLEALLTAAAGDLLISPVP